MTDLKKKTRSSFQNISGLAGVRNARKETSKFPMSGVCRKKGNWQKWKELRRKIKIQRQDKTRSAEKEVYSWKGRACLAWNSEHCPFAVLCLVLKCKDTFYTALLLHRIFSEEETLSAFLFVSHQEEKGLVLKELKKCWNFLLLVWRNLSEKKKMIFLEHQMISLLFEKRFSLALRFCLPFSIFKKDSAETASKLFPEQTGWEEPWGGLPVGELQHYTDERRKLELVRVQKKISLKVRSTNAKVAEESCWKL